MSFVITTYVPEGIVMASDSRQSLTISRKDADGVDLPQVETPNSDSVYKTYLLSRTGANGKPLFEVGVSSFGDDLLGGMPTATHIRRFSEQELVDRDNVTTIPEKLVSFIRRSFPEVDTGFHLAGYRKEDGISVPYVYYCHVGRNVSGQRKNTRQDGSIFYGATWSGLADVITGLVNPRLVPDGEGGKRPEEPFFPIIWDAMPLQDAIDFSVFAIRTTIDTIRFQARPKSVGGPIDILIITPDGAEWIQRKVLRGE